MGTNLRSVFLLQKKINHYTIIIRIKVDRIEIASARVSEGEFQG
jgi:hypothetical protein